VKNDRIFSSKEFPGLNPANEEEKVRRETLPWKLIQGIFITSQKIYGGGPEKETRGMGDFWLWRLAQVCGMQGPSRAKRMLLNQGTLLKGELPK